MIIQLDPLFPLMELYARFHNPHKKTHMKNWLLNLIKVFMWQQKQDSQYFVSECIGTWL